MDYRFVARRNAARQIKKTRRYVLAAKGRLITDDPIASYLDHESRQFAVS